jgi:hypothetical protein
MPNNFKTRLTNLLKMFHDKAKKTEAAISEVKHSQFCTSESGLFPNKA